SLCLGTITTYFFLRSETEIVDNRAAIAQLEASIGVLNKQHEIDEATRNYRLLESEVNKLEATRRDWLPVLNSITSKLPEGVGINTWGVTSEERLTLSLVGSELVE